MHSVMRVAVVATLLLMVAAGVAASHHPSRHLYPKAPTLKLDSQASGSNVADEGMRAHQANMEIIREAQKLREQISAQPHSQQPHHPKRTRHMRVPDDQIVYLDPVSPRDESIPHTLNDGYQLHPAQPNPIPGGSSKLNFTTFKYPTKQGMVTIYVGITEYPIGKFHIYPAPRNFGAGQFEKNLAKLVSSTQAKSKWLSPLAIAAEKFLEQRKKNSLCDGVAETSVSAQHYGCEFAQNAGFFDISTSSCLGDVYSDGVSINTASAGLAGHAHFGLTKNHNFVTGYLTPAQVSKGIDGGFEQLVTGAGWLVREGKNYINQSYVIEGLGIGFVQEIAPRNALAHDKFGRLLQFEADGEEDIDLGLNLWQFSEILLQHFDVVNAVNMDGGGSSTTVYNGVVVDHPTCHDTPEECERSVTTISCVMP